MNIRLAALSLVLSLGAGGCATAQRTTERASTPAPAAPPAAQVTVRDAGGTPATTAALEALAAAPVYFSLDSATLTPEAQESLERLARALRQRPQARVTVSGHTCELGTTEYNLALGQRRADIVRGHLVRLGVESGAIQVLSYGEERPADEQALAMNRRAEFSFLATE